MLAVGKTDARELSSSLSRDRWLRRMLDRLVDSQSTPIEKRIAS
jgi:hypothetical protein